MLINIMVIKNMYCFLLIKFEYDYVPLDDSKLLLSFFSNMQKINTLYMIDTLLQFFKAIMLFHMVDVIAEK